MAAFTTIIAAASLAAGAVSAVSQRNAAKKAASQQAEALRQSAEQQAKQSRDIADSAANQARMAAQQAAVRADVEALSATNKPQEVVVDIGTPDSAQPTRRKRQQYQGPAAGTAAAADTGSIRI